MLVCCWEFVRPPAFACKSVSTHPNCREKSLRPELEDKTPKQPILTHPAISTHILQKHLYPKMITENDIKKKECENHCKARSSLQINSGMNSFGLSQDIRICQLVRRTFMTSAGKTSPVFRVVFDVAQRNANLTSSAQIPPCPLGKQSCAM